MPWKDPAKRREFYRARSRRRRLDPAFRALEIARKARWRDANPGRDAAAGRARYRAVFTPEFRAEQKRLRDEARARDTVIRARSGAPEPSDRPRQRPTARRLPEDRRRQLAGGISVAEHERAVEEFLRATRDNDPDRVRDVEVRHGVLTDEQMARKRAREVTLKADS